MPTTIPHHGAGLRVCMRVNNEYTGDLRVRREAETLAAAGHDVAVVADARTHLSDSETLAGVRVIRVRKTSRVPYRDIVEPLIRERADVYHAHDIDSLLPCIVAAKRAGTGARVIYDSHELWSAHAPDKMHSKRRTLVRFEGPMVRACDAVISVSPAITSEIAHLHRFSGLTETILNVPRRYTDAELAPAWAERDSRAGVDIAYVGVFQAGRGAVPLVSALGHLPQEYTVELIGPFAQPDYERAVREAAAPYGDRVRFTGRVPADEIVPRLAAAKLSAVLIEPISTSYRMSSPNKLYDSLAAGTPVIASDLDVIGAVTRETGAGIVCDVADPSDIARAALEAVSRSGELREAARRAAGRYNWEAEQVKLLALYERLSSSRRVDG